MELGNVVKTVKDKATFKSHIVQMERIAVDSNGRLIVAFKSHIVQMEPVADGETFYVALSFKSHIVQMEPVTCQAQTRTR